jgi:hypothetical protein
LAAHKLLGERPHFGGKYSEDVISQGIKMLEDVKRTPPRPPRQTPIGPSLIDRPSAYSAKCSELIRDPRALNKQGCPLAKTI